MDNFMEKIVSLAKRRGFVFPDSEIYGGLANTWDFGPLGVELKNNIKNSWWSRFVHQRDDIVGLDAALIMNPKVWDASGHLRGFKDFLIECKHCHERFKVEDLLGGGGWEKEYEFLETLSPGDQEKRVRDLFKKCPNCSTVGQFAVPRKFNLMFKTFFGPVYDEKSTVYFRPETAQAMFVDFKNILNSSRIKLPFGIAQIGKAFRNEITPGNFIFRTREFEQMEIEYFVEEKDWEKHFEYWRTEVPSWLKEIGIDSNKLHELEVPDGERAHYSKRTIDFEYDFPFGKKELFGLAYRTDFDLKNHETASGENMKYKDAETGKEFWPHVIEPSLGVERTFLAVLASAYSEDGDRVVLKLPPAIAPYKAAVFPLLANKPELVKLARKIYEDLRKKFYVAWDERGNIGKRYYAQDEIGTPHCITVDFDSLEKGDATVRDRDTAKQERIKIDRLEEYIGRGLI
ncbi:MAG: glycine--tRNA ligase [Patescibacteria group bacterium]|nr:glycine--tRNA ligase [Patescibacteria group bacterium]MDE2015591.1 glycine--tRNA ligase [Patescibacteria group bacterium]MDE2226648.1 glycine--tRNA ligase [Patescibacteria group bacterium]